MATEQSRNTRTFVAGEDLSTAQFKFVTLEADGEVELLVIGNADRRIESLVHQKVRPGISCPARRVGRR